MTERDSVIQELEILETRSRLTPDMRGVVSAAISHIKSYPAGKSAAAARPDNLAFWFEGLEKGDSWYERDRDPTLPDRINEMRSDFSSRIHQIEHDIRKHRIKVIKGRKYWYFWADGKHNSKGPVDGQPDPRIPLRKQVEQLRAQMSEKEGLMLSCVMKKLGQHAVIDVELFRKHVDKRLPAEAVQISEMLSYPEGSSTSSRKPDNEGGSS